MKPKIIYPKSQIINYLANILFFTFSILNAETLTFSIDYLGFSVASVVMTLQDSDDIQNDIDIQKKIAVQAVSSRFTTLLKNTFDNTYTSYIDHNFRPLIYQRGIQQSNFQEEATVEYHFDTLQASYYDSVNERSETYQILGNTRDFFTTLYYLRTLDLQQSHELTLDVAGKIILISTRHTGVETLRTNIGRVRTNKVEIYFTWYDDKEKMQSDILTNNLYNEDNILIFWFTNDENQIPVKSQYTRKPFPVYWSITNHTG